jgi:hypothetical protein
VLVVIAEQAISGTPCSLTIRQNPASSNRSLLGKNPRRAKNSIAANRIEPTDRKSVFCIELAACDE